MRTPSSSTLQRLQTEHYSTYRQRSVVDGPKHRHSFPFSTRTVKKEEGHRDTCAERLRTDSIRARAASCHSSNDRQKVSISTRTERDSTTWYLCMAEIRTDNDSYIPAAFGCRSPKHRQGLPIRVGIARVGGDALLYHLSH